MERDGFVPQEIEMGQKLMRLRADKTQDEVSRALSVRRETVKQWENAERHIKATDLIKLSEYYGVSVDYLLGISDIQAVSADVQGAIKTLGISQKAVERIRYVSDHFCEQDGGRDALDSILSSEGLIEAVVMLSAERKKLLSIADEAQGRYEEIQSGIDIPQEKVAGNLLWCTDARERAEYAAFKASKYFTSVLTEALGDTVEVIDILCDLISQNLGKAAGKRGGTDGE